MGTLSLDISKIKQNNMLNFAIIIDFLISLEAMKREFQYGYMVVAIVTLKFGSM